jgi:hypothetical protein
VAKADAARREQTRRLLEAGALHSGEDYRHAAFVFQHGDSPADYLLAHALAMVAVTKGEATAIWIAAATLDRYLQTIGQKQIFGTQFLTHSQNGREVWTQEPYDSEPDFRRATGSVRSSSTEGAGGAVEGVSGAEVKGFAGVLARFCAGSGQSSPGEIRN